MANKQVVAQIGVFALLGLNVGAYYVFWPHRESDNRTEAQAPAPKKGSAQLLPEKKDKPTPPMEAPTLAAPPLQIPNPPAVVPEKKGDDDSLARLLEHIQKETGSTPKAPPASPADVGLPPLAPQAVTKPNPTVQADPLLGDLKPTDNPGVAVTSPLTPKIAPSPWLMNMEVIGNQTQLTAKLKQPALEFKIRAERVEMKAPGGTVQAHGKVTVVGGGLVGACQRLTVPLHETQLIFEIQVDIVNNANSNLRGDRIIWELSAIPDTQPLAPPAEFRTVGPFPAFLPPLDKLK